MPWLFITLLAYFFLALEVILDKFLLSSKRVSHPVIYAFYAGTVGLFALVFIPFGFHAINFSDFIFRALAGIIFIYGMLSLFFALEKSEASRVIPVVGAVVPVIIFFFSIVLLGERLSGKEIIGLLALISGGVWIAYDFESEKRFKLFPGFRWSILAGILLALSATIFKKFYQLENNFFNVYIWTRIGAFLGVITFFLVPHWRKAIVQSIIKFRKPGREHKKSGLLFVLTRALGGSGSILKEKATSLTLASVAVVNALVSLEYVFVFVLGLFFSLWMPGVFQEKKDRKNILQKVLAIFVITLGIILVSRHK